MPIRELLNKIRWDENFRAASFTVGYYDRIDKTLRLVRLEDLTFPRDSHRIFELIDEAGETHRIPLHRIKAVYRDGRLIWHREH